jgi:hypothetical protein
MKTLKLAIAGALLLTLAPGCAGSQARPEAGSAAPTADAKAIALAFAAAAELKQLVTKAREGGHACCQPRTPSGKRVAALLESTADYLEAASAAQKLARTDVADLNLREAGKLLAQVRRIVAPFTQDGDPQ